jgi:drug/metabolite transporter (DMT)-like permease
MGDRRARRTGLALVLASALAYGTMPILAKLAYASGVQPVGLLAARYVLAAALFALLARPGAARPPLRARLVLWGLGGVFAVNSLAYFFALRHAPASLVAMVLYTYPVMVTLLSALLGLEALTVRGLTSALLAFAGAGLAVGGAPAGGAALGLGLALLAALGYSLYTVLTSRHAASATSEEAARHVSETCAFVSLVGAVATGQWRLPAAPQAWAAIAGIAVVCTVFALRAFLAGLSRVGPTSAAVVSSCEVVVTVVLAVGLLGESVGPLQWLGGGLILSGVALRALGRRGPV